MKANHVRSASAVASIGELSRTRPAVAWMGAHGRIWLVGFLVVLAVAWLPRGLALDRLVTPDEPLWLGRSANFYQALAHGNLQDTFQYLHPGVTVMWIGTLGYLLGDPGYGPEVAAQIGGQQDVGSKPGEAIAEILAERGVDPLEMLAKLRAVMVIANTLVLAAMFLAIWRLFGMWVALLGSVLIAFDPFNIALSRLLHLDGLSSNLMVLSLLLFLVFAWRGRQTRVLLVSGFVAGLAWLTRSATVFLAPFLCLLTMAALLVHWRAGSVLTRRDVLSAIASLAVWGLAGLVTFVALWPAMWVDPIQTLRLTIEGALGLATDGERLNQSFFNGAIHGGDPGALFYPITFLWRTTPAVLLGLLLAAIVALASGLRAKARPADAAPLIALLLFTLLYGAALTVTAKKYDRYLLPVFAPLDIIAAWGWVQAALVLAPSELRRRLPGGLTMPLVLGTVAVFQVATAAPTFPYYLSYYNPLLGGTSAAPAVMPIGWGEGLDQVADYLNAQPDAASTTVAVAAPHRTLTYLFDGTTLRAVFPDASDGNAQGEFAEALLTWAKSDYYALYVTSRQEGGVPGPFLEYFAAHAPVMTARIQGLDYAQLYDIRVAELPDAFLSEGSSVTDWGGAMRLVAYESPPDRLKAGEKLAPRFYVQALDQTAASADDLLLVMRVIDENGRPVAAEQTSVTPPREPRTIWPVAVSVQLPSDAAPGTYRVEVEFRDSASGAALSWSRPGATDAQGTALTVGSIRVGRGARADPGIVEDDAAPQRGDRARDRDRAPDDRGNRARRERSTPVSASPAG